MPIEYGGAGLGVTEASIMMQEVGRSAGAFAACSTVHINIFGLHSIVKHGTDEQKKRWLPSIIDGSSRACFGVTEPDAGLDTSKIKTRAVLQGDKYVVHGQKIWTSTAQQADKIVLLARTTPIEQCAKPAEGLSLFYTDLDRSNVEVREIPKMGRHAVNSNQTFFDGLVVPVEHRIGEEGKGFRYILDCLNPERILIAAEVVGMGRRALEKAVKYANERVVFGRPIGKNQSIQHPLAECWSELYAAELMALHAAQLYDAGVAVRRAGQCREIPGGRCGLSRLRSGHPNPWRHGLRRRIPRRALLPRNGRNATRAGVARNDPELHRGA